MDGACTCASACARMHVVMVVAAVVGGGLCRACELTGHDERVKTIADPVGADKVRVHVVPRVPPVYLSTEQFGAHAACDIVGITLCSLHPYLGIANPTQVASTQWQGTQVLRAPPRVPSTMDNIALQNGTLFGFVPQKSTQQTSTSMCSTAAAS